MGGGSFYWSPIERLPLCTREPSPGLFRCLPVIECYTICLIFRRAGSKINGGKLIAISPRRLGDCTRLRLAIMRDGYSCEDAYFMDTRATRWSPPRSRIVKPRVIRFIYALVQFAFYDRSRRRPTKLNTYMLSHARPRGIHKKKKEQAITTVAVTKITRRGQ